MQKCKYLDDLGIPRKEQGTNFIKGSFKRRRRWAKARKKYGFDERETWDLERSFVEWIYTRVMMYKDCTKDIIDLKFHKIPYKDAEITQKEAIDRILQLSQAYLKDDTVNHNAVKDICDLWKEVSYCMWW